jgi:XTP/dITP diphosphohydrolase
MTRFVLATANPAKAREIKEVIQTEYEDIEVIPLDPSWPEVIEDGATLEANALLKADAATARALIPALADDTGLEVSALQGAPGVRSARYASDEATDAQNIAFLLDQMRTVSAENRAARFTTVAIAKWPDGKTLLATGSVYGVIAERPRGDAGFGYDPVFVPTEGDGRTFAEMSPVEKHKLSHRGRAFRSLAHKLVDLERSV